MKMPTIRAPVLSTSTLYVSLGVKGNSHGLAAQKPGWLELMLENQHTVFPSSLYNGEVTSQIKNRHPLPGVYQAVIYLHIGPLVNKWFYLSATKQSEKTQDGVVVWKLSSAMKLPDYLWNSSISTSPISQGCCEGKRKGQINR